MEEGEVLLLVTPGLMASTRLLPSPSGSRVTLEVEEKKHFVGLRAESAPAGMGHHAQPPMIQAGRGMGAEPPL